MDEIVQKVAAAAGIDEGLAKRAVEIVFELVREHGPKDKVKELFSLLPGADLGSLEETGGGGLLSSLGGLGGLGGAMGAMGALNKMTEAGLSMDQVQIVGKQVIAYSREHAGEDLVGEVVGAIPGLSQFV